MNKKTNCMKRLSEWTLDKAMDLFSLPFHDLIYQAQTIHKEHFPDAKIQLTTLLNIKVGGCPEDCHYCPQAARYHTGVKAKKLASVEIVRKEVMAAKAAGATRFCMSAAWRELKDRDLPALTELIKEIRSQGLESCVTLGMLTMTQAEALKEAGLDYYNHNIDTSAEYYKKIITTRTYEDRLQTLEHVRRSGMKVCSGGIIGMGETTMDRAAMLLTLANLTPPPESVPINDLMRVEGTPLNDLPPIDVLDIVRTIAAARIMIPKARVRLAAGRITLSDEAQALCFLAGANSIFYGREVLNTTPNPGADKDRKLFARLGYAFESLNG